MAFSDIPIRVNQRLNFITAEWFNTIRSELVAAFGSGGFVVEEAEQSIAASGTITVSSDSFKSLIPIKSTGGAVDLSLTPFGSSHGFSGGKEIVLLGTDNTDVPTILINDAVNGFYGNGKIVLSKGVTVLLIWSEELSRFVRQV